MLWTGQRWTLISCCGSPCFIVGVSYLALNVHDSTHVDQSRCLQRFRHVFTTSPINYSVLANADSVQSFFCAVRHAVSYQLPATGGPMRWAASDSCSCGGLRVQGVVCMHRCALLLWAWLVTGIITGNRTPEHLIRLLYHVRGGVLHVGCGLQVPAPQNWAWYVHGWQGAGFGQLCPSVDDQSLP